MIKMKEEAQRCLLCIDAPCNRACPKDLHPARGLRALRWDNPAAAGQWLTDACADCDAPCEKACLNTDFPVRIKELAAQVSSVQPDLTNLPSLEIDFCGVHCENPFFLASSAVCTNYEMVARAFEMGWGGVVFKTIGTTAMKEVSPRFDATDGFSGFRNMEQISENTPEENFDILARLKKNYPTKIIVASIMGSTEEEWIELAKRAEAAGADIIELNFSCPQMRLAGMGSDVGQNSELVAFYTGYVAHSVKIPVLAKMTPNITHIYDPAIAACIAGAAGIAAINTIKSITMTSRSQVGDKWTVSGYSGRAVKPIALRHIYELTSNRLIRNSPRTIHFSGIGGIETWRDAMDFIELGCGNVQVCTAVMEYGYRIIEDLILGTQLYMKEKGVTSLQELVGTKIDSFVLPHDLDRETKVFPKWDRDKCVGCGRCYVACQDAGHQAIEFGADRKPKLIGQNCVGCHLCRLVCPEEAIGAAKRMPK